MKASLGKGKTMKRIVTKLAKTASVLALGATMCLTTVTAFADGAQDFTLHNKTGKTIKEVYIGPHSEDEWGEDVMGDDVLGDGDEVKISFDADEEATSWDMKVVFDDGKNSVWTKLQLQEITDITISYKTGKPWATWKKVK